MGNIWSKRREKREYIWHAGVMYSGPEQGVNNMMSFTFKWGEISTVEAARKQKDYIKQEVTAQADVEVTKVTIISISKLGEAA